MFEGPDISRIAALIGDPSRANMLCALMDGRALTATELANVSTVTKQTASMHLAQLTDAGLLTREAHGRHRYFRLANSDVARALEALMGVAQRSTGQRVRVGPRDPALRHARVCYDHLAGEVAVAFLEGMIDRGLIERHAAADRPVLDLTPAGRDWAQAIGIDIHTLTAARRPPCRACLDWSARRHHLGGSVGAALLDLGLEKGWMKRARTSRGVTFAPTGEAHLMALL